MPGHDEVATAPIAQGRAPGSFAPGDLLGRRYLVTRFIARGGMGEVYEVQDQHLGVRVALKTIRAESGLDPRALERFKREVLLARAITHPNVCRIFDLGAHETAATLPVAFLTMELLEGETLGERLRREGPLRPEALLPLLRQVVAGLKAAHDAGVVHRDLKAANLMLTPLPGGNERVVITDFGLALQVETGGEPLSSAGVILGTPAYMAPEQVEGQVVGPAADVYALGVVMYEAVTGERPFRADSPMYEAMKRLTEPPPSPSSKVPGLPAAWEQAILRCLARQPEARFARIEDVVAAVERPPAPEPSPRAREGPLAATLGAVATSRSALLGRRDLGSSSASPEKRRCVAVLGLKNLAGRSQDAWVATALAEILGSELAAGETLRVLPGESAARLRADLGIPEGDLLAPDTLRRLRVAAGVDVILVGGFLATESAGRRVRLDLRLQDAASSEEMRPVTASGTLDRLAELASAAGAALRDRLGVDEAGTEAGAAARAEFPARPEAARLYAEGVARLRVFDSVTARDLLLEAVAVEPEHPMIHRALGQAYSLLGQTTPALEEARRAFETSAALAREHRLVVEATYRSLDRQPGKAVEILRALRTFFPDNLDHGIALAEALVQSGQPVEAQAVLDELRQLSRPLGDDPRIDHAEAVAAEAVPDFERCLRAARAASAGAQARGARLLVARALVYEGRALVRLGRGAEAAGPVGRAVAAFAAIGDRGAEASAAYTLGILHYDLGELRPARAAYEQSLDASRAVENRTSEVWALSNLAALALLGGDLEESEARSRESRVAAEASRLEPVVVFQAVVESFLRLAQGRLALGRQTAERALDLARRTNDLRVPSALWVLGEIELAEGQVDTATRLCQAAADESRSQGVRMMEVVALAALGRCRLASDDREGARATAAAACRLGEEIRNRLWGPRALAVRSEVELAQGDPIAAERTARAGRATLGDEPAPWVGAQVDLALAAALLAAGRTGEAAEAAAGACRSAEASHSPQLVLEARLRTAEVDLARGRTADALVGLGDVATEAHRLGVHLLELEARLAMGRGQIAAGQGQAGQATLDGVASAAAARGLARVAHLAAESRAG